MTYLDRCDTFPIEDPAQAWNALTIGAYTNLVDVGAEGTPHEGWTAVAEPGDLSPLSRTGVVFQRQWPIKPDILLEGGNAAMSPNGSDVDTPESMQILTTSANPAAKLLTTINATSAATAQAAHMAATIAAEYPWPLARERARPPRPLRPVDPSDASPNGCRRYEPPRSCSVHPPLWL